MPELSRRAHGNISGLTDRLVVKGVAHWRDDPARRHAQIASITAEGKRQFRAMAPAHERWIVGLFIGLSAPQQARLFCWGS